MAAQHLSSSPDVTRRSWRLQWCVFLFLWVSFAYSYHTGQHNENAHFDQLRALADEGSWNIDRFAGNTADVITVNGHIFPNKAPGITFLGLLPWILFRAVLSLTPLSEAIQIHFVGYFVTLSTLGLFSALTGCALGCFLYRLGLSRPAALFFALLYSLGTIAFPFSTVLFSHQLAASFLFLGFFLLWKQRQGKVAAAGLQVAAAGALLGFAPLLEYPAALGTIIIGLYGLTSLSRRHFLFFLAAGMAAGSLLLFYNWMAFHRLFFISYEAYNTPDSAFAGHRLGFAGVSWPRWSILYQITFVRRRGLFYVNPWLVLIFPAVVTLRESIWRRELLVCFGMVVAFFIFNSGFGDSIVYWGGAWSVGPRHLIPMLPFMTVPIALLCRQRYFLIAAVALGSISLLAMFCVTAVSPVVPYEAHDPFLHFYLRQFFLGRVALNAGGIFANQFRPGFSSNCGQLLGLPPRAQILPLAVLWALALPLLFRATPSFASASLWVRRAPLFLGAAVLSLSLAPLLWDPYAIDRPGWAQGLTGMIAPGPFVQNVSSADADASFLRPERVIYHRDSTIDFTWDKTNEPFPAPFGGIWKGALYVPAPGVYTLVLESDDGAALYLDNYPVIDHWRIGSPLRQNAVVGLSKGFHPLALHYENAMFSGRLRLFWSPPELPQEIIPPEFLFTQ